MKAAAVIVLLGILFQGSTCEECEDNDDRCRTQAFKQFCNLPSIRATCPYSCGDCEKPVPCEDVDSRCPSFESGCINDAIKNLCPKTCKLCGGEDECKDSALWCSRNENLCSTNAYMRESCKKTCRICDGTSDINECQDPSLNNCDENAICIDTKDAFQCQCKDGYTGDGFTCFGVDDCKDSALWCPSNVRRCPTDAYVRESCKKTCGVCEGKDNCLVNNNCDANAACLNTLGSYRCQCNPGYTGDGQSCIECKDSSLWCRRMSASQCASDEYIRNTCKKTCGQCDDDDEDTHPCDENPCQNGANCVKKGKMYECNCPPNFEGKHCEKVLQPDECKDEALWCPGYADQCDSNEHVNDVCKKTCDNCGMNVCETNRCQNGGKCRRKGSDYRCNCPKYFSGKYCEIGQVQTGLRWIGQVKDRVIGEIKDFSEYDYDNVTDMSIRDGRADMYDTGNEVFFWANGEDSTQIVYGSYYDRGDYEFQSTKRMPFTALLRIKNAARTRSSYSIKVESETGADGKGTLVYFDGNFVSRGVNVVYKVTQVHSARDPSICEVYFAFNKGKSLKSSFKTQRVSDGTSEISTTVTLEDYPQNVWMGYTLLSRYKALVADVITEAEIKKILGHLVEGLYVLPSPTQQALARIDLEKHKIVNSIPDFHSYIYDSISDKMITDGGSDMYNDGNKVSFRVQDSPKTQITYGEHYSGRGFEFASSKGSPFTALMHFDKMGKRRFSYSPTIQVESNIGGNRCHKLKRFEGMATSLGKEVQYFVAQVYGAGVPTTCEVYFALSQKKSTKRLLEGNTHLSGAGKLTSLARLPNYAQDAWLGYMLLSRTNGELIEESEIVSALNVLSLSFLECPVDSLEFALQRVKASQDLISSEVTSFSLYDYGSSPMKIVEPSMYNDGNNVFFWTDMDPKTQISYESFYRRNGYQLSSTRGWPFIMLMRIDNVDRTHASFYVQVQSETRHFSGSSANFEGSIIAYDVEVTYSVTQSFSPDRSDAVCEVYFAFSTEASLNQSFQTTRIVTKAENHDTTVTLSNYPQDAWMGYMLLSKNEEQGSVSKLEAENALSRLVRTILNSNCPA